MAITIQDVRDILPPDVEAVVSDDAIQAAIDASQCIIDQFSGTFCGVSYSEACLDQVHIYLAAHFLAVTNPTLTISSESSDECCRASVKYGWSFDKGILGTPFGQVANSLSCGCLQEWDKTPANIFSIGSHGGDAADYYA